MPGRDLDVVVFGATSITGRQVAAYLAERAAASELSWAAAARDLGKLERVLGEAGVEAPASIAADVGDPEALLAMASRAKVVVNLVGPYTLYGEPVISACVAGGAHYVDLTGEIPFARRMLDRFGAAAAAAGVKIVQTCGFEALPPDLAVRLAAEAAADRYGEELREVEVEVAITAMPGGMPRASDMVSGGTIQSMAEVTADPDAARVADPALLVEDPAQARSIRARSPIKLAPRRNSRGAVIAPMSPAAFINPAVIHRSAAIVASESGQPLVPFGYREGVAIGGGPATLPLRYAAAGALSALQTGMVATARASPAVRRRVSETMRKVLPSSGFGPSADRLEDWRWRLDVSATTTGDNRVEVAVDADGHPGYLATARMLGEVGLLLAEADATPGRSGYLTPATALGTATADRFKLARVRFSVTD